MEEPSDTSHGRLPLSRAKDHDFCGEIVDLKPKVHDICGEIADLKAHEHDFCAEIADFVYGRGFLCCIQAVVISWLRFSVDLANDDHL